MTGISNAAEDVQKRVPWNKSKIVGANPPLRPKHVWSIRTKLRLRDESVIWRCSTSRSRVSFVAATWWA
ncbi:hypothetical protein ABIB68_007175 [Bradyrhizobium sp. F1.2.2]